MVGRVQVVGHVERALAGAVERLIAGRRDDPIVPADITKVDVERPATTADMVALAWSGGRTSSAVAGLSGRPFAVTPAASTSTAVTTSRDVDID